MLQKIISKIIGIALMLLAPFVAYKALSEWVRIRFFELQPSYPLGKKWLLELENDHISFLSNYPKQMLSIGLVCAGIAILAYVAILVKTMLKLVWLACLIGVVYFIYLKIK
jgi:hypothetical protein